MGISFSPEVLKTFLREIYDGFDTSNEIEPTMFREILRLLNEATVEGLMESRYEPTHEDYFLQSLKHSNEVFSAFKTHTMGEKMAARLLDENGKLKSFRQWKEYVKGIASHYVGSWLQTEYNTAVIRAHNAADWQLFERDKDIMPNLRWMPTTSPEPEATHHSFWARKLTLPVDHPFWNHQHPGNRWNCKCYLEQTDEPANPEVLDEFTPAPPQRGLENNPGKDGHIFNDTHPYFPKSCGKCAFCKNSDLKNRVKVYFSNRTKNCFNCPFIEGCIDVIQNEGFILNKEFKNGGKLYIHKNADSDKSDSKDILTIARWFAKRGDTVRIPPRVHIKSQEYDKIYGSLKNTKYYGKCPDLEINGVFYEYEGYTRPWNKKKIKNEINHGLKQSSRIIIDNNKGASDRYIKKLIYDRIRLNVEIDEVWAFEKGKLRLIVKKKQED